MNNDVELAQLIQQMGKALENASRAEVYGLQNEKTKYMDEAKSIAQKIHELDVDEKTNFNKSADRFARGLGTVLMLVGATYLWDWPGFALAIGVILKFTKAREA